MIDLATDKLIPRPSSGTHMYVAFVLVVPRPYRYASTANQPKLAPLSIALGALYITVFAIELYGVFSAISVSHFATYYCSIYLTFL